MYFHILHLQSRLHTKTLEMYIHNKEIDIKLNAWNSIRMLACALTWFQLNDTQIFRTLHQHNIYFSGNQSYNKIKF